MRRRRGWREPRALTAGEIEVESRAGGEAKARKRDAGGDRESGRGKEGLRDRGILGASTRISTCIRADRQADRQAGKQAAGYVGRAGKGKRRGEGRREREPWSEQGREIVSEAATERRHGDREEDPERPRLSAALQLDRFDRLDPPVALRFHLFGQDRCRRCPFGRCPTCLSSVSPPGCSAIQLQH